MNKVNGIIKPLSSDLSFFDDQKHINEKYYGPTRWSFISKTEFFGNNGKVITVNFYFRTLLQESINQFTKSARKSQATGGSEMDHWCISNDFSGELSVKCVSNVSNFI